MELCRGRPFFASRQSSLHPLIFLLLVALVWIPQGVCGVEARMESQFEKCCGLGTSWASEGLRCEKFTGPVSGVPRIEQGLCLEAVDICCVRAYHEKSCEKGKDDARAGLACVQGEKSKNSPCPGDEQRDCCEGCKLGILTGSMGQGCAFKSFTFGKPWDPSFLECCHEASPTTTNTYSDTSSSSSSSMSTVSMDTTLSINETTIPSSSSSSSMFPSDSTSPNIPTPGLDDICQLMKGLLCSDICVPTPGSFYCKCPDDSILLEDGKTCRKNKPEDRCKSANPCEHRCTDTGATVVCSCNPGFALAEDAHSCSPISGRFGQPTDEDNELEPQCPGGYKYNKTGQVCDDIDECETNPCPGVCKNVVGSFACLAGDEATDKDFKESPQESCPPGFQWDPQLQICTDIDECAELSGACREDNFLCVNTLGSFTCHEVIGPQACPAGFKYDAAAKICKDVDECGEGIDGCLPEVEECRNTEGAYECDIKCRKGFAFSRRSGICLDVDECTESLHPCPDPETRCVNNVGGYECKKLSSFEENETNDTVPSKSAANNPVSSDDCINENGEDICLNRSENSIENAQEVPGATLGEDAASEPEVAGTDYEDVVVRDEKYTDIRESPGAGNSLVGKTSVKNCSAGAFYNAESRRCECQAGYEFDTSGGECRVPFERASKKVIPSTSSYPTFEPCHLGYKRDGSTGNCKDVDECVVGPGCLDDERCDNTPGGYNCSPLCSVGWQFDPATKSCQDVDECILGRHDCAASTHRCANTNGSYVCERVTACSAGFRRIYNGNCVDVDECVEGPGCREHERCKNLPGGYDCSPLCGAGWRFDPSSKGCLDVDECLLGRHDCPQGTHRCVNVNGTYNCQLVPPCTSGFRKLFNGSCVDIDECAENLHDCPLSFHRYCVNREGTYECVTRYPECAKGFEYSLRSRKCEDIDECAKGTFSCDSRFSEKCVNLPGSYKCERPPSPGLSQRQRPACPSGFRYDTGRRQCIDIDECAEGVHSCGNEVCYNQPGGYSCARAPVPIVPKPRPPVVNKDPPAPGQHCQPGTKFMRNRGCVDINECVEDPDACTSNEQCVNTPGSFVCECKLGFRRDELTQACVDINECQLENNCQASQRCDNTLGSYTCVRYLPCGTGYTLNAATDFCEDDNECELGTHDCTGGYHCRNTLGSYRCDRNSRITTAGPQVVVVKSDTPTTPAGVAITTGVRGSCPPGYNVGPRGQCIDIDECQRSPNPCARSSLQKCVNTMGSYRCVSRVLCGNGYTLDPNSGSHCVDVDECADGTHECGPGQTCKNRQGGYICECPPGHVIGPNRDCIDVDECSYAGQGFGSVCGSNSRCENTVGSYRCICESGFENIATGHGPGVCQDVDECEKTPGLCQHNCVNAWGSYRCSCRPGFRLNADNRSCTDIDECTEFKENNLCIGICENTPGSYACNCPAGYKLGVDQRTCQDIDECSSGRVCRDPNEVCQNTRGSFRCNKINCPQGYYRDNERKNRCLRTSRYCPSGDLACFRAPSHYSYNFITFVSMLPIPSTGQLELFTMRGTHLPGSTVQFNMALVDARAPPGVVRATESCFALRRPAPSQAVLVLTRSISGPQEIELDLSMEIYHNTAFAGSAVAKLFIFVSQYEF